MNKIPFFIFILIGCIVLNGCGQHDQKFQSQLLGFGTIISLTIRGVSQQEFNNIHHQVQQRIHVMHNQWHAWQKSELSALNHSISQQQSFKASNRLLPLIIEAKQLAAQSNQHFNPAIGKLIALWGFHKNLPGPDKFPESKVIKEWVQSNPSMVDLRIDGNTIHSKNSDVKIDLGGFAKGYGIREIINHLKQSGIKNAILNAGGDLHALGKATTLRPWKIGVKDPRKEGVMAVISLENDESVFTSGGYERYFEHQNKRYSHIIDPTTGYPSDEMLSVTVIHKDPALADAAATAIYVAGIQHWKTIIIKMNIDNYIVMDKNEHININKTLFKRTHFEDSIDQQKINIIE